MLIHLIHVFKLFKFTQNIQILCKKISAYYVISNVKHALQDGGKYETLSLEMSPGIYWCSLYF